MATPDKAFKILATAFDKMVEDVMTESLKRIKRRTPVSSGDARDSWKLDLHDNSISSDIGYMENLELGTSTKAPQGMVRVTALEAELMSAKSLRKNLK